MPLLAVLVTVEHLPSHDHAGEVGLKDGAVHSVRSHAYLVGGEACGVDLRFVARVVASSLLHEHVLHVLTDGQPAPHVVVVRDSAVDDALAHLRCCLSPARGCGQGTEETVAVSGHIFWAVATRFPVWHVVPCVYVVAGVALCCCWVWRVLSESWLLFRRLLSWMGGVVVLLWVVPLLVRSSSR